MLYTHYCFVSNFVSDMEKLYHLAKSYLVCGLLLGVSEEEFVVS